MREEAMPDPKEKWTLTQAERTVLGAAANAFFPPNGPILMSGCDAHVVEWFENYVTRSLPTQRILIRLLFVFTELSPLVFGPKRARFTKLSQAERIEVLDRASRSSVYFRRVTFTALRAMMTMAYLCNPMVARTMNMNADTDPFGLDKKPSRPTQAPRAAEVAL
jgi:hypothetical protein